MAIYTVRLLNKKEVATDTIAFYFEKPIGFQFRAGQYGDFTLINPPETDDEGSIRSFSLASTPEETEIMVATRMRDTAFKRVLNSMPLGAEVKLDAPHGDFVLHDSRSPAVFLTGGIGITPVRSMVAHATATHRSRRLLLFYANKTLHDTAFFGDLERLAKENHLFTFIPVMTRASAAQWDGERGHIDKEMLRRYIKDLSAPTYYLSGPPEMAAAMRNLLMGARVDEEHVRTEEFTGY